MELSEVNEKFIVKIGSTGNKDAGYFVVDTKKGTLYSSYTGATINKSEIVTGEKQESHPRAVISTTSKTFSYKQIAEIVSDIADKYTIAGAIIALTALAMGVTIATTPATVVTLIGATFVIIIKALKTPKKTEGVQVYINKNKVEKHQAGQIFVTYSYSISKVGTY